DHLKVWDGESKENHELGFTYVSYHKIDITDTEILDHNSDRDANECEKGGVSVLVTFEYDNKTFYFDFQTSRTSDAYAVSSNLSAYSDNNYDDFTNHFKVADDEYNTELLDAVEQSVKEQSHADELWTEYIKKNYITDDSDYDGFDGNSERNDMVRRELEITFEESYTFTNLAELRDFLNDFKTTDLSTVLPKDSDYITLRYVKQTLSDYSEVIDFRINHT
ncbi:MAG: hypothetical protein JKY33_10505, partial [Bacteroidia bacterium]|nr:hypothetical protein [Bacteroidia bacterium]